MRLTRVLSGTSSHCQTVSTRNPSARIARTFLESRFRLAAILTSHQSRLVRGGRASLQPGWPCQKQPCTKTHHLRALFATSVKLPRFTGQVVKAYAAFSFSKQSSNASGVS